MDALKILTWMGLALLLCIFFAWLFMIASYVAFETGPGCKGDPNWLGYCSEVQK